MCMTFVDYEKAFDSVEHHEVMDALHKHQVHKTYIELLISLYNGCTSQIRLHGKNSRKFPIMIVVRQGDTLSPSMLNAGLEQILRALSWEEKGISINGEKLHHLRFADDIVLISHTAAELQSLRSYMLKA